MPLVDKDNNSPSPRLNPNKTDSFKRDVWSREIQFALSLIGYTIGLGSIWRFPYLVMEHGGGAFLIPYLIFLFICGIPLCFMEFTIGQYTGLSPGKVFTFVPITQGIGWAMLVLCCIFCMYYNIVMSWILYYFGMSFQWELPWKSCNNSWNTENCFSSSYSLANKNNSINSSTLTSSVEEFWKHNVLEISPDISIVGGLNWKLSICFIVNWTLIFLCLIKGIKTSGKVVYVTATAPYIFLTIILIRGVTLEGSLLGLEFFFKPHWASLMDINIWSTASIQVLYSLGPGWGGLITMSSYNKFYKRYNREACLLPLLSAFTSIFAGLAVYSVIGHMCYMQGTKDIKSVMKAGPGLIFIVYPEALALLPGAAIWTVLFFFILFTIGLDSQFATLETMTSTFIDQFPSTIGKNKISFTFGVCLVELLFGLVLASRGGMYYFQLFDWYSSSISVLIIATVEAFVIAYLYDAKNLLMNAEAMLGKMHKISKSIWLAWYYIIIPIVTLTIFGFSIYDYSPPILANGHPFPDWAISLGWCMTFTSVAVIPLFAMYETFKRRKNLLSLFQKNPDLIKVVTERINENQPSEMIKIEDMSSL